MRLAPNSLAFIVLLGLLAALPALSIDICAPTLPLLLKALDTSTTVADLTVSLFMAGFAIGQFGGGRLSDRVGRRPVLIAGLACYTIAGIGCLLATSGPELVGFRLMQGIGAGGCAVLPFAMVQDLYQGDDARTKRSYITVVLGAAPVLAPAVGSVLSEFGGWRAVYVVLAIGGSLLLLTAPFAIPESKRSTPVTTDRATTSRLRNDTAFIGLAISNALSYGAIFSYIAGAPIVIIGIMKLSPAVFSGIFASTALALTAGAWTSGRLGRYGFGATALLNPSLAIAVAATLALAAVSLTGLSWAILLLPPLLITLFTRGAIAPNIQHLAIERRREQAGAASAALGVSQLAAGAIASGVVAFLLPEFGARAIAVPMALLAAGAFVVWHWTVRTGRGGEPLPLPT